MLTTLANPVIGFGRFWRFALSQDGDGFSKSVAQIERCFMERFPLECRPEIELVALCTAGEAVEDILGWVHRKGSTICGVD